MLELILTDTQHDLTDLQKQLRALADALRVERHPDAHALVRAAEEGVRRDPANAFAFDAEGRATLQVGGHAWSAGHFEAVSIGTLRRRAQTQRGTKSGRARLFVLTGASALTDIGALQAMSGPDTLFQVASQFNCLESPGPFVTSVSQYFSDYTQGPRASISAFPATLLRHYAAPRADGTRFVQRTDGEQLDLLARACGRSVAHNGYFTGDGLAPDMLEQALSEQFEEIEIGLHSGAEVALGHDWDGMVGAAPPRIAQAFTSTAAGGPYGAEEILGRHFVPIATHLLRAAYTATLLGAITLGCRRVVLTQIGGGVFHNPAPLIWQALVQAIDDVQPLLAHDLDVVLNAYQLPPELDVATVVLPEVRTRGGSLMTFGESGLLSIEQ